VAILGLANASPFPQSFQRDVSSTDTYVVMTSTNCSVAALNQLLSGVPQDHVLDRTPFAALGITQLTVELTGSQFQKFSSSPLIGSIAHDKTSHQVVAHTKPQETAPLTKRLNQNPLDGQFPADKPITRTPNPPSHLKVNSFKEGSNTFDGYAQFSTAGEGTWIYVVDSGFTKFGDEFDNVPDIVNLNAYKEKDSDTSDTNGHGTSVAAMAVGKAFGVAPKASLVTIKIGGDPLNLNWADTSAALMRAINHIVENHREGKAVINLSSEFHNIDCAAWETIFKALIQNDIILFNSVGNVDSRVAGDHKDNIPTPAKCNKINTSSSVAEKDRIGNIITVGYTAVLSNREDPIHSTPIHQRGLKSRDGGMETVNLWAVGDIRQCPSNAGPKDQEGTSFASPQAAAMGAYMLSLSEIDSLTGKTTGGRIDKMRTLLQDLSFQRPITIPVTGGRPEIWNGMVTS